VTLALVLKALGDVRFGDRYDEQDKVQDFKATFLANDRGMRALSLLTDMGGWLEALAPIDMQGKETPMMMAFREGRRSVITDIMHLLANDDPSLPEVITGEE
jgi:hypothetical protein